MTDENYSGKQVVNDATGGSTNSSPAQLDSTPMAEVSMLLQACRGDLDLVELILGKLESPILQSVHPASGLPDDANLAPNALPDLKGTGYEAETVRRLAHHIENLYRSAESHGVEEMLDELQAKMVRCLRLIPANRTHAKAS